MSAVGEQSLATFRDPAGSLRIQGEQVLRTVTAEYAAEALRFLTSDTGKRWIREGRMVESHVLSSGENQPLLLEHPRVFFPSYPWEWTPVQLIAAGELTLDLSEELLDRGWILKDATPLNILFEGCRPVLVDVLSVERRNVEDPLWMAYGQFARTFLLPLAAYRHLGWPLAATLSRRDGYEPADLYSYFSASRRWSAPIRSLVTLPYLMEKRKKPGNATPRKLRQQPEIATAVLRRNLRRLRKALRSLEPEDRNSRWSDYPVTAAHYAEEDRQQKQSFVRRVMNSLRPGSVLDIGGNTGEYSRIAAGAGAQVVAWDTDVGACERNWRQARASSLPIQPLVVDMARPTPSVGWRNGESLSLLERAVGRFDCAMMLGVLHHLLVADQVPLDEVADLLASLTRRWAIVEWVPKTDPRFIDLSRGRDELYAHLDEPRFRASFSRHFAQIEREELKNGRVLYLFEKA